MVGQLNFAKVTNVTGRSLFAVAICLASAIWIIAEIKHSDVSVPKFNLAEAFIDNLFNNIYSNTLNATNESLTLSSNNIIIKNAAFLFNNEVDEDNYKNKDNIITGYQPFYASNCPLHKFSYQCFPENRLKSMYNVTLSFSLNVNNTNNKIKENLYQKYIQHQLKINSTIFPVPNVNIFFFGNSHLRQIYESLQCMVWNQHLLNQKDVKSPAVIISGNQHAKFLDFADRSKTTNMPCMYTTNLESGFVNYLTMGKYRNWTDFAKNYLKMEEQDILKQDKKRCMDDKSVIKFRNDNSNIFYSFQNLQTNKSLISEFKQYADFSDMDLFAFINGLDVIIMNTGNEPHYDFQHKLISELKEILKSRDNQQRLLLIVTGNFNVLNMSYTDGIKQEVERLGISYLMANMAKMTLLIKTNNTKLYKSWGRMGHYCMPGLPSHFMLFYLKIINTFLLQRET